MIQKESKKEKQIWITVEVLGCVVAWSLPETVYCPVLFADVGALELQVLSELEHAD